MVGKKDCPPYYYNHIKNDEYIESAPSKNIGKGTKKPARMRVSGRSQTVVNYVLAEEEGFEPSVRVNVHTLSKRAPSASRTLFLCF